MRRPRGGLSTGDAEAVAVAVLERLAADPERLGRFLVLTGLDPSNLRRAAASPGFLASVLDHVAADEPLLVETAAEMSIPPERVMAARAVLSPEAHEEP